MLYYLATACGFIDCDGYFTANIRHAKPFESFEAADVQLLNKKRELDRLDAYVDRDYVIQFKPCGGQYASSTS